MAQYNSLNVKVSNSELNKLKSAIKNETEVILRLSPKIIGDDETNFPHKQFQIFAKLLQIIYQQISNYQQLNYLRWYNQHNFLADYLIYY